VRELFHDKTGGVYGIGAMTLDLPLPDEKPVPTFYNRHGDWFGWSCVGIMAILLCVRIARAGRK
jgi:apolipoprotein N-acyltransferase